MTNRTNTNAFSTLPITFVRVESVDFSSYAEETIDLPPLLIVFPSSSKSGSLRSNATTSATVAHIATDTGKTTFWTSERTCAYSLFVSLEDFDDDSDDARTMMSSSDSPLRIIVLLVCFQSRRRRRRRRRNYYKNDLDVCLLDSFY